MESRLGREEDDGGGEKRWEDGQPRAKRGKREDDERWWKMVSEDEAVQNTFPDQHNTSQTDPVYSDEDSSWSHMKNFKPQKTKK